VRFRVLGLSVVRIDGRRAAFGGITVGETEQMWRRRGNSRLEGIGAAVEDLVYGVYYVVDETLRSISLCSQLSLSRDTDVQLEAKRNAL
jgi:hypothetical protein